MAAYNKRRGHLGLSVLSVSIIVICLGISLWTNLTAQGKTWGEFSLAKTPEFMAIAIQNNSLLPLSGPTASPLSTQTIPMLLTAYSSSVWETDSTPHLTASGTNVRPGVVANNLLPIGTRIKIPKLYGNRVFVIEDRMNSRKGSYQLDIWFPSSLEARVFGVKNADVEVLD